jgi:hypothetical protein
MPERCTGAPAITGSMPRKKDNPALSVTASGLSDTAPPRT